MAYVEPVQINGSPMWECASGLDTCATFSNFKFWYSPTNSVDTGGIYTDITKYLGVSRYNSRLADWAPGGLGTSGPSNDVFTATIDFDPGISVFNHGSGIKGAAMIVFNNWWQDVNNDIQRTQITKLIDIDPGYRGMDFKYTFIKRQVWPYDVVDCDVEVLQRHEDAVQDAIARAGYCSGKNGWFGAPSLNLGRGNSGNAVEAKQQFLASLNWGAEVTTTNSIQTNKYFYVWVGGQGSNAVTTLQYKDDLNSTNWASWGTETNDQFGNGVFVVPWTNASRFFRTCTATN